MRLWWGRHGRLPPEAPRPAFEQAAADGWPAPTGTYVSTTAAGEREAAALTRVVDVPAGRAVDDLRAAPGAIANRLLAEDWAVSGPNRRRRAAHRRAASQVRGAAHRAGAVPRGQRAYTATKSRVAWT
ncbi:hypothetical protein [Actinacidiphila sp. bgisy144]|uniref:hypothetical protein n=1 Tax=Actinacidiphila sp. bgisy144 TaxID=3413791 RepID=UPI003EBDC7C7